MNPNFKRFFLISIAIIAAVVLLFFLSGLGWSVCQKVNCQEITSNDAYIFGYFSVGAIIFFCIIGATLVILVSIVVFLKCMFLAQVKIEKLLNRCIPTEPINV